MPPEYLFQSTISNKFDIFILGVIMTKIIAGHAGHTKSAEMPYQEFLDLVRSTYFSNLFITLLVIHVNNYTCILVLQLTEYLQVNENWRNRFEETTSSLWRLEAYCQQVNICTEIAIRCMETDRHKRPTVVDIIQKLNETETVVDKVTVFVNKKLVTCSFIRNKHANGTAPSNSTDQGS
jgi:predicted RND superfamily exporter protein